MCLRTVFTQSNIAVEAFASGPDFDSLNIILVFVFLIIRSILILAYFAICVWQVELLLGSAVLFLMPTDCKLYEWLPHFFILLVHRRFIHDLFSCWLDQLLLVCVDEFACIFQLLIYFEFIWDFFLFFALFWIVWSWPRFLGFGVMMVAGYVLVLIPFEMCAFV